MDGNDNDRNAAPSEANVEAHAEARSATPAAAPAAPSEMVAALIVDELIRCGTREAVVCPGSRSAPLALSLIHI